WKCFAWLLFCALFSKMTFAQTTAPLQHLWEIDPDFGDIWARTDPGRSPYIDLQGLSSDQTQVRMEIARKIALNYDRDGFQNPERALELLIQAIERDEKSSVLNRALLSAACALDDGTHAPILWQSAQKDIAARRTVERGLIRWKNPIALDFWRSVVREASSSIEDMTLAIEGLGAAGSSEDIDLLLKVLESNQTHPVHRILAAKAIGGRKNTGLAAVAQRYFDSEIPDKDLVAAHLLQNQNDDASARLLQSLQNSVSSPAQLLAAAGLARNFRSTAELLLDQWVTKEDLNFRRLAMQIISDMPPQDGIHRAIVLVSDNDHQLRSDARRFLLQCATSGDRELINECVSKLLAGTAWQGMEQGIILAVELQDATRCEAFLALLDHPQAEVHMHAAWGLMELANDAAIVEKIHQYAERMTNLLEQGKANFQKSETIRMSFLLEALGRQRYEPAYSMLIKYIPKNDFKMGNLTRASAIWSIGQMRQDRDLPDLRSQLSERIGDLPPDKPENYLVRFACIIALGRMGYSDSVAVIEQYGGAPPNPLGLAAQWSLSRIRESGK
ncbi:MAG: HEAT repeat domain-containing protein, partial [Pirellula sp.]|nr:HEAT repeat domain-containing protein [Pirellula sp.]